MYIYINKKEKYPRKIGNFSDNSRMYEENKFSKNILSAGKEVKASLTALANITFLKKLCNHPDLIYDKIAERADGFENAYKLLPSNYNKK